MRACIAIVTVASAIASPVHALSPVRETKPIDFSSLHSTYAFAGEIPYTWEVRFIPQIQAISLFDPNGPGATSLEKSQIFIRNFNADRFLTLPTVAIHARTHDTINGHQAVRYDIEKKKGVAPFSHQPTWRNGKHEVVDIRFFHKKRGPFFVFAKNPSLSQVTFQEFLDSLVFYNDQRSFQQPLPDATARMNRKPFGLFVSPQSSPVQGEKFRGFHTGVDYEIKDGEEKDSVVVSAICGGVLKEKKKATGYSGVLTQECSLNDQPLTVVYGHIDLADSRYKPGDFLAPGGRVGALAKAHSPESGFERKHLHLGVLKGKSRDIRGYVNTKKELASWINPFTLFAKEKK